MLKVVFDTNVIISGLIFKGIPRKLLRQVIEGHLELFISKKILSEVEGVLAEKKFGYPSDLIIAIINELISISHVVDTTAKLDLIEKDPDDNAILECALEAKVKFVVTGDAHLLQFKQFQDIIILKPADFYKIIS